MPKEQKSETSRRKEEFKILTYVISFRIIFQINSAMKYLKIRYWILKAISSLEKYFILSFQ